MIGTKILLIFVFTAIGTASGFTVMRAYRRDLAYLSGVCAMIDELKRNISYRKDGAADILRGYKSESDRLTVNIGEYLKYAAEKDGTLEISKGYLSAPVHKAVCGFFASLGRSDGDAQLKELDAYGSSFCKLRDAAKEKSEKYGALAVKLGFLFGLGVGVLFL